MIIYKITNLINNKIYIGQTIRSLEVRIKAHTHAKSYIGKALRKYGLENFKIEVIDTASSADDLNSKEKYWIETYNTISPSGYNLKEGGVQGRLSKESIEKISKTLTGRKVPLEVVKKVSEKRKKTVYKIDKKTNEVIAKYNSVFDVEKDGYCRQLVSKCAKFYGIKKYSHSGYYWKYETESNTTKDNLLNKASKNNDKKRTIKLEKDGVVLSFNSQKEAADLLDCQTSMFTMLRKGRLKTVKGYKLCSE